MHLKIVCAAVWTVAAPVDARGRCRVKEDLDALRHTDGTARSQIVALLERVTREGPPNDPRRSRHLGGSVYELKTPRGWRLFYFVDRGRLIVCTELSRKPKPRHLRAVVLRAQRVRADYVAAQTTGTIVMEDSPWQA